VPAAAPVSTDVADLSASLFDQPQILDGEVTAAFAARLNWLLTRGLPTG
jgi:hypothetical protein